MNKLFVPDDDGTGQLSSKDWARLLQKYRHPDDRRSVLELGVTVVPFLLLWATAAAVVPINVLLGLILCIPTAGFLTRIFVIQHDCGHGAFFTRRWMNDWVGRTLGVATVTPYYYWQKSHAEHHATSGDLDRRREVDIQTLTTREYGALPRWPQLKYRAVRSPFVLLLLAPAFVFLLRYRVPVGYMRSGKCFWISTMGTNCAIVLLAIWLIALVGLIPFLTVFLTTTLLTGAVGIWLFYVQHQFEDTYWKANTQWNVHDAALHGSSHYDLPPILRWLTGNIGVHHVHHLNCRIPFYRLYEVLEDQQTLHRMKRLTFRQSLSLFRLQLWDEDSQKMVSFKAARSASLRGVAPAVNDWIPAVKPEGST